MPSMHVNPTAHCRSCGAIPKQPHGPVIEMIPSRIAEYKRRYAERGHGEPANPFEHRKWEVPMRQWDLESRLA